MLSSQERALVFARRDREEEHARDDVESPKWCQNKSESAPTRRKSLKAKQDTHPDETFLTALFSIARSTIARLTRRFLPKAASCSAIFLLRVAIDWR